MLHPNQELKPPANPARFKTDAQSAETVYYEGTPEDDVSLQTKDANEPNATAVDVVSKEGDNFIQTTGEIGTIPYKSSVYAGQGDDTVCLGGVDS